MGALLLSLVRNRCEIGAGEVGVPGEGVALLAVDEEADFGDAGRLA